MSECFKPKNGLQQNSCNPFFRYYDIKCLELKKNVCPMEHALVNKAEQT